MTTATVLSVAELVKLAADEATVIVPESAVRVRLRRLDGKKVSKALMAAVEATGAALVSRELREMGLGYCKALERIAAEHVSDERAFTLACVAWVYGKVGSDRVLILPSGVLEDE